MKKININAETGEVTEYELTKEELIVINEINSIITGIPYAQKVVGLIREKYTIDEELSIQRQKETKPDEFETYFNYCEECKIKAKENVQL